MSKFYGTLTGSAKTTATRRGTSNSGIMTEATSWNGCISVRVYEDCNGIEKFSVVMKPWHGHGDTRIIASGVMGDSTSINMHNDNE